LFVAAVNEKTCVAPAPGRNHNSVPAPDIRVREIPVELLDFGRPLPIEACFSFGTIRKHRRT
jgi:hypothetical protein